MAKATETDYDYALLMEGKMDLMFLPAGAVAWLWKYERPESQIEGATYAASAASRAGNPVVDAALLRSDQNILVLHLESGDSLNVYPSGDYGAGGEVITSVDDYVQATVYGDTDDMSVDVGDEETVALPDDTAMAAPVEI